MTNERRKRAAYSAIKGFWEQERLLMAQNLDSLRDLVGQYPRGASSHALRAEASYIHDFYNSVENLFKAVAQQCDGAVPAGDAWHKTLLMEMCTQLPGIRTALIGQEVFLMLEEILRFRHLVRNSYGILLESRKTRTVTKKVFSCEPIFCREVAAFIDSLAR